MCMCLGDQRWIKKACKITPLYQYWFSEASSTYVLFGISLEYVSIYLHLDFKFAFRKDNLLDFLCKYSKCVIWFLITHFNQMNTCALCTAQWSPAFVTFWWCILFRGEFRGIFTPYHTIKFVEGVKVGMHVHLLHPLVRRLCLWSNDIIRT